MSTNFPAALDDFNNPTPSDNLNSATVPHSAQHANANDAIEALQAKVGVDGSADVASIDYRVTALEAGGGGGGGGSWGSITGTLADQTDLQSALDAKAPTVVRNSVTVQGANGYGSTTTCIPRYSNILDNTGTAITYADSATLGNSFTINADGLYTILATFWYDTGGGSGISLNSNELSTPIYSLVDPTDRLANLGGPAQTTHIVPWTGYLTSGDVVRAHNDGQFSTAVPSINKFTIIKLA